MAYRFPGPRCMVRVFLGILSIWLILALVYRRLPGYPRRSLTSSPVVGQSQHGYVSPNEILKSTAIGVKTYNQPQCLKQFIASARLFAPYLTIFVADDSRTEARTTILQDMEQGDIYVELPTDSGTGYGRNRIVEAVAEAGFQYLIMADDDFKLTSAETLPLMMRHLQDTGADIVAPMRCDPDLDNCDRNKAMLVVDQQRNLTILPNVTMYLPYAQAPTCFRSDFVQQFFIGRVDTLRQVQWDDKLKNNDHYDFLLNAKEHALSLVSCTDIRILHEKSCETLSEYQASYNQTRAGRWFDLLGYIFRKWNLRYLHDMAGKLMWVNSIGSGVAKETPVQRYPTYSNETRNLLNLWTDAQNAWKPGKRWIIPVINAKTSVCRKKYGPCVNLISGVTQSKLDRHKSQRVPVKTSAFSQFVYDESCTFAEKFWNVSRHGHYNMQSHVYYVTAVANDIANLIRLLHVLDKQLARTSLTLIVVVMDTITTAALESNRPLIGLDWEILDIGPPFSRSVGMRVGFEHAIQMARERGQRGAIGFSIDTSILAPIDFTERIQKGTICSVSAFVPIVFKCYSCSQEDTRNLTNGYWVITGFGMLGLCLIDYTRLGGWNVEWGYHWGAEDVEIMARVVAFMPHVVRAKEEGYFHVKSATLKHQNHQYYKKVNTFNKAPPCSLTVNVVNEKLLNRFINFIKESIPEFKEMEVGRVNATRTYLTDAKEIMYHVMLTNHHDESDSRWVLIHSWLSPVF